MTANAVAKEIVDAAFHIHTGSSMAFRKNPPQSREDAKKTK